MIYPFHSFSFKKQKKQGVFFFLKNVLDLLSLSLIFAKRLWMDVVTKSKVFFYYGIFCESIISFL